ncbi:MAG: recombination regulator RecX [Endomicrobium sp.]|uniref:regulatory protein RecX n=1 Tax=Candidatus Endomicrobiellum cubanum TaxID=3242325 RepID=UPI002825E532|nr:recombination regulator RecX [Endomicrobium sp.]
MKILIKKIEKMHVNKNMFKLYFENGDSLIVFSDTIVKFSLRPGISILENDYNELISYDKSNKVMFDSLKLLSKKAYSENSLREKLIQKGYNTDIANKALTRLKELNYINDDNYAKNYALYLYKKGKGAFLIKAELEKQGIEKDLIKETLEKIKEEGESFEVILKILKTKFKNFNNKDKNETKKVISFFLRRGFAFEDISRAIKNNIDCDSI